MVGREIVIELDGDVMVIDADFEEEWTEDECWQAAVDYVLSNIQVMVR